MSAVTPKPAFSFLDRFSLVPAADSWTARSGSDVSPVLADSAGFQVFAPNRASADWYDVDRDFLDLTLSSPSTDGLSSCRVFNIEIGRSDSVGIRAVLPFPILATPTGVSPSSAAEQKHHQQNNQYGLHTLPPLVRKS
jgi:hypothetical protein